MTNSRFVSYSLLLTVFFGVYFFSTISTAYAASNSVHLDSFPMKTLNNKASLQNGAKLFMNYCIGCHGISQVRYGKLQDLGLSKNQIKDNLIFNEKLTMASSILTSMSQDSKVWFGKRPPDLSLTAKSRSSSDGSGADWIYTYLRSFYKDPTQATGWNNTVYPGVNMPHVLWDMQGIRNAVYSEKDDGGTKKLIIDRFVFVTPGTLSSSEYDDNIADLTAFLVWTAEPEGQFRKRLGVWVILFLSLFAFMAWRLNAAYWKDIK
tara:strand:+ start:218 stop:1006 length:789 start_codon:yes stop_codon:yes gene_type:complete